MEYYSIGRLSEQLRNPVPGRHHLVPLNKRIIEASSLFLFFIFIQGVPAFLGTGKKCTMQNSY